MIQRVPKKKCCGCSACMQTCPKRCIEMKADEEGFLYPFVNMDGCINCGLCESACPILNKQTNDAHDLVKPRAIGGWHKDEEIRYESSSGGAFSLFAENIIKQGGIVYGVILDDKMRAMHVGVDKIEDLHNLRGSKYVQSDINGAYIEIKDWLQRSRKVLFVGTPCQAGGLFSYLGHQNNENLYICDFICHGTPSPKVFQKYIQYIEQKYGSTVTGFKFRMKDKSWSPTGFQMGTKIEIHNNKNVRKFPAFMDPFMNGFLDDLYLRPSCYNCEFKKIPKYYADLTIADFWGVDKLDEELCDTKGTSLLLIHSTKGMKLFDEVKVDFYYKECDFCASIYKNESLLESAGPNKSRNAFFVDLENKSFKYVVMKYMSPFPWAYHKFCKILKTFKW